jgi:hypothetical protein
MYSRLTVAISIQYHAVVMKFLICNECTRMENLQETKNALRVTGNGI